jgi:hypothetical protein
MLSESLLAAALSFTPWHGDAESEAERAARLTTIAEAIHIAAQNAVCAQDAPALPPLGDEPPEASAPEGGPPPCVRLWNGDARQLAFLLLTQAYFETHLAQHVHEGNCRVHLGECDGGRATSLWQLHYGPHLAKERWEKLAGTDLAATAHSAYEASRALSRGRNHCGSVVGAISLYATGRSCSWEPAEQRATFLERLSNRY